ncbi:MAG: hypothetical protein U9Q04_09295 [Campylobacterota bacterium]|nr:hypothetical protein [Campylobacterota bacterium]
MSFKQAKELTERFELAELSLNETLKKLDKASGDFDDSLNKQKEILYHIPKTDKKLNMMQIIVALNVGFITGLLVSKYIF